MTFELEAIDRMYLNADVPSLQTGGGVVYFLKTQLGAGLTEEHLRDVLLALQPSGGRPRGETWSQCVAQREAIERWLRQGVRLSKIRKRLARTGVAIPYHRKGDRGPRPAE